MGTPLRSQRVLQRLTQSTCRSYFTAPPKSKLHTGSCILCQHRHRLRSQTQVPGITTTPSPRNCTFTTTTAPRSPTPDSSSTSTPIIPNPPKTTTHYTIFPQTFPESKHPYAIDTALLRREFLSLQNTLHPDKYLPGPLKHQAEALSARINEAYRTLLNPLLRALYILHEYHGVDVTAEDGSGTGGKPLDPELLMEVMDVQEEIEELSGDAGAEGRIEEMKRENERRVGECVTGLEEAFEQGDVEAARDLCVKLKFWVSVGDGLREWEPGMEGIRLIH